MAPTDHNLKTDVVFLNESDIDKPGKEEIQDHNDFLESEAFQKLSRKDKRAFKRSLSKSKYQKIAKKIIQDKKK